MLNLPARRVTPQGAHHFFGYYDKSPWNADGSLVLAHEATFNDRPPKAGDRITLGVIGIASGNGHGARAGAVERAGLHLRRPFPPGRRHTPGPAAVHFGKNAPGRARGHTTCPDGRACHRMALAGNVIGELSK